MVDMESKSTPANGLNPALQQMLQTYTELNATEVNELYQWPSALQFMRYVAVNRPFIIRQGASEWDSCRKWNRDYLLATLGDSNVNVAITPHGNADAVVQDPDGSLVYAEPLEQQEPFDQVLDYIIRSEHDHDLKPVMYAQTQNDNLRNEYDVLFADVPPSIPFARIALEKEPDAVNFWLGNSRSVTSMHKDNYENIYAQIRGKKHFILLPPVMAPWVQEQRLPLARYVANASTAEEGSSHERFRVSKRPVKDEPSNEIPVPTWDPEDGASNTADAAKKPINVTLNEGDMLYLPAMWYHKVKQSCADEAFCCSVNYW